MSNARRRSGERGSILAFLLLCMVLMAGGILSLAVVEQARERRIVMEDRGKRTFELDESTIEESAALLTAGALGENGALNWANDGVDNDGDGRVDEGDEEVSATLTSWHTDGRDNDGDGQVDENDEAVVRVATTGTVGGVTHRLTGWLRRAAATLPSPEAAVYLNDPSASTTFQGNSFDVDGTDRNLNGSAGPAPSIYGIAINGPKTQVTSSLSKIQLDNVNGKGGWPSVTSWTPPNPDFIDETIDALGSRASIVFDHYAQNFTGTLGNASTGNFVITKSIGDLKIAGGSTGAGILLVDGNLEISGNWDYVGYVFVAGRVTMKGGGGTKRLRGAMFVDADLIQASTIQLWINGTVDLL
ncbi:MAG TPA: hypothetical protein VKF62_07185, partial [Planctomycetota bacterium]|nr:hypothetical protein [Planctomycetota bacterium]